MKLNSPKDGGWKQWLLREMQSIPGALINLFAWVAMGVIAFGRFQ
jgi:hypothetical protein